ncbi:guanosine-3',5'-bis(diphosphate) 3'-pyrophosphohydrolase [Caedimonas varicaedens]|uniref:Guanosine-3',5'-bis(Diphosphate) 3'-pyrophosphohydrolase n=1 Tax=Caedimonas varicaedens TaxID=1629334 RepID=A0A0K8MAX9_9PROT|nr:guanosine-3',5'-bis(diphosphate) 3'-pyrophosphohydrolase [Caedimonas varicaedens]
MNTPYDPAEPLTSRPSPSLEAFNPRIMRKAGEFLVVPLRKVVPLKRPVAHDAMIFALQAHEGQKRRYNGEPYWLHLAEVAGMVSTLHHDPEVMAVAWLHDCLEDCPVTFEYICQRFGRLVAEGVLALSDLEQGNRKERKRQSRERLSRQSAWIQDIKVCDVMSNTASIVQCDPAFAKVYLREKRRLLDVLTKADVSLRTLAYVKLEEMMF